MLAEREVILAAGAINSPQLLMLSGVGPADHLRQNGIEIVLDLAGVGQNLQDHPSVTIDYDRAGRSAFQNNLRFDRLAASMIRARLFGTGFATQIPVCVTAFLKSSADRKLPDLQLFCSLGRPGAGPWFPVVKPA